MNLSEKLKHLRNKIIEGSEISYDKTSSLDNSKLDFQSISLNNKVDNFINWYFKNMVEGYYMGLLEERKLNDLRDFIEKMAVWYELKCQHFNDFYTKEEFLSSLSKKEKAFFQIPEHRTLVYVDSNHSCAHLHLTPSGIVISSEHLDEYTKFKVDDKDLIGMHIENVINLLKDNQIYLPFYNELESTVNNIANHIYLKEEMLNCVMYRIIERGGKKLGPRRAFLFAQEFGRNINIPMMYGIDYSIYNLDLINEYIKAGGSKELMCYVNYFQKVIKTEKVNTVSVGDLIEKFSKINGEVKKDKSTQLILKK